MLVNRTAAEKLLESQKAKATSKISSLHESINKVILEIKELEKIKQSPELSKKYFLEKEKAEIRAKELISEEKRAEIKEVIEEIKKEIQVIEETGKSTKLSKEYFDKEKQKLTQEQKNAGTPGAAEKVKKKIQVIEETGKSTKLSKEYFDKEKQALEQKLKTKMELAQKDVAVKGAIEKIEKKIDQLKRISSSPEMSKEHFSAAINLLIKQKNDQEETQEKYNHYSRLDIGDFIEEKKELRANLLSEKKINPYKSVEEINKGFKTLLRSVQLNSISLSELQLEIKRLGIGNAQDKKLWEDIFKKCSSNPEETQKINLF